MEAQKNSGSGAAQLAAATQQPGAGLAGPATSAAQPASGAPVLPPVDPAWLGAKLRAQRATVEAQTRAKVLAELGVEDPDKFKASREEQAKKLSEYERTAEETKRSTMSEVEKLRSDVTSRDQRIAQLEQQLQAREVDVQAARADVVVRETIHDHIDPTMQEDAQEALRRHVRALPKEAQKRFGKVEAAEFFRKLAKDKPRYARDAATPAPAKKVDPVRRPLSNGASPSKAAPLSGKPVPAVLGASNGAKPKTKEELADGWKKFGAPGRPY
jgi:hypothetical protein